MVNKAAKARCDALVRMGCIVCRLYYTRYTMPTIHHLGGIKYRAMGKKALDENTIPLCPKHHQYGSNEHPSVHGQPRLFVERYGTQEHLLEQTNRMLGLGTW